jgi:hypothetical protein
MAVGVEESNLCMSGFIPMTQPLITVEECSVAIKDISEYVNQDFKERNIAMNLQCVRNNYGTTNI